MRRGPSDSSKMSLRISTTRSGLTPRMLANIERVTVDVDELEAWCRSRGWPVDGKSRAQFVVHLLRRRGIEFETDPKIEKIEDDIPF